MEFVDYAPQAYIDRPPPFYTAVRHACTLSEATDAGFDPGAYEWLEVPEGTWEGRLDFKTWSNKKGRGSLLCYFTETRTGKRFRLSAARPLVCDARRYTPRDRAIDFSTANLDGRVFCLRVGRDGKGNVVWIGAITGG
ncbi:hypothetical protein GCM10010872_14670 [Dyella flava]|nr:hypothetical protein GCM10010872_14670 [Dyella flava]